MDSLPYLGKEQQDEILQKKQRKTSDQIEEIKRKKVPLKEIYDKLDKYMYPHFEYMIMGLSYVYEITRVRDDIIGIFNWIPPEKHEDKLCHQVKPTDYLDTILKKSTQTNPWTVEENCMRQIEKTIAFDHIKYIKSMVDESGENVYGSLWIIRERLNNHLLTNVEIHPEYRILGTIKYMNFYRFDDLNPIYWHKYQCDMMKRVFNHETKNVETKVELHMKIHTDATIKLFWNSDSKVPKIANALMHFNDLIVEQTIDPKFKNIHLESLWDDMILLDRIRTTITTYRDSDEKKKNLQYRPLFKPNNEITLSEMSNKIDYILNDPLVSETSLNRDLKLIDIIFCACTRKSLLLTDKLWMVLKEAPSFEILSLSFHHIYDSVQSGLADESHFYNSTSTNHLYTVLYGLYKKNFMITQPKLEGTVILELLLDIGLDKLCRDYIYIYTRSRICFKPNVYTTQYTEFSCRCDYPKDKEIFDYLWLTNIPKIRSQKTFEDTYSIIGIPPSKFVPSTVEGQLARLIQLHTVIVHLVACPVNIDDLDVYNFVITELIEPPESVKWAMTHKSRKEIEIMNVNHILSIDLDMPSLIRVSMKTISPKGWLESIYYMNSEQIFPRDVFKIMSEKAKHKAYVVCKETQYFGFHYLKYGVLKSPETMATTSDDECDIKKTDQVKSADKTTPKGEGEITTVPEESCLESTATELDRGKLPVKPLVETKDKSNTPDKLVEEKTPQKKISPRKKGKSKTPESLPSEKTPTVLAEKGKTPQKKTPGKKEISKTPEIPSIVVTATITDEEQSPKKLPVETTKKSEVEKPVTVTVPVQEKQQEIISPGKKEKSKTPEIVSVEKPAIPVEKKTPETKILPISKGKSKTPEKSPVDETATVSAEKKTPQNTTVKKEKSKTPESLPVEKTATVTDVVKQLPVKQPAETKEKSKMPENLLVDKAATEPVKEKTPIKSEVDKKEIVHKSQQSILSDEPSQDKKEISNTSEVAKLPDKPATDIAQKSVQTKTSGQPSSEKKELPQKTVKIADKPSVDQKDKPSTSSNVTIPEKLKENPNKTCHYKKGKKKSPKSRKN